MTQWHMIVPLGVILMGSCFWHGDIYIYIYIIYIYIYIYIYREHIKFLLLFRYGCYVVSRVCNYLQNELISNVYQVA